MSESVDHLQKYWLLDERQRRQRSEVSLDPAVSYADTVLAGSLSSEKSRIILQVAQRVGWAFGWDITQEFLDRHYTSYGQVR
jgi:hypothetical protein